jgi:hypothetical protein
MPARAVPGLNEGSLAGPATGSQPPTAVHAFTDVHETPKSSLSRGLWFGVLLTDQTVPFQVSTRVRIE